MTLQRAWKHATELKLNYCQCGNKKAHQAPLFLACSYLTFKCKSRHPFSYFSMRQCIIGKIQISLLTIPIAFFLFSLWKGWFNRQQVFNQKAAQELLLFRKKKHSVKKLCYIPQYYKLINIIVSKNVKWTALWGQNVMGLLHTCMTQHMVLFIHRKQFV